MSRTTSLARIAALIACILATSVEAQDSAAAAAPRGPAVLAWTAGPKLEQGRDHHVTFVTEARGGRWLHVNGGNTYRGVLQDGWRAPIARDGSVGAWVAEDSLPAPRAGHSVVVADRHVVLTAGQTTGGTYITEVLTAEVRADGTLGAWSAQAPLPAPRFHHASVAHGGFVYVIGGLESQRSTATVFRGRLSRDGRIAAWETLAPLPRPRSHQGAFVHEGALYLAAGLDGNPAGEHEPLKDVVRARILPDGGLGEWETVSTLPHAYGTHASFAHGGFAYLLGGVEDNARFVDVVLRAPFQRDGTLGEWQQVEERLPLARSHVHQTPVAGGVVYTVGGSNRRQVNGEMYVGRFR